MLDDGWTGEFGRCFGRETAGIAVHCIAGDSIRARCTVQYRVEEERWIVFSYLSRMRFVIELVQQQRNSKSTLF